MVVCTDVECITLQLLKLIYPGEAFCQDRSYYTRLPVWSDDCVFVGLCLGMLVILNHESFSLSLCFPPRSF